MAQSKAKNRSRDLLQERLREHGLKFTHQRELIAELFLEQDHITVDELFQKVSKRDPSIGVITVYRTLKLLCQWELAQERHFGTGKTIYDNVAWKSHHDHLICTHCGRIIEFENFQIEQFQEQVARQHNFRITFHKLELYGVCKSCEADDRAKARAARSVSHHHSH
ncbi:MAG: Fur family transcriptional regulator [Nitrospirota bacterium]